MKTNFQRTNHFLILTLGAVLIGFAPIFVKWSMLSSSAISFYRMLLAIPFLFLLNFNSYFITALFLCIFTSSKILLTTFVFLTSKSRCLVMKTYRSTRHLTRQSVKAYRSNKVPCLESIEILHMSLCNY